jgi:hypothetical protein
MLFDFSLAAEPCVVLCFLNIIVNRSDVLAENITTSCLRENNVYRARTSVAFRNFDWVSIWMRVLRPYYWNIP